MEYLTPHITVSPQISPEDIATLKANGVTHIICHRPDDEDPNQIPFADIEAVAEEAGITAIHIPVQGGEFPAQAIHQTAEILAKNERTHMYCRSGTRSTIIWAACEASHGKNLDEIIDTAAQAGYGIGQLRAFLATHQS